MISGNIKIQNGLSAFAPTDMNLFVPEARGISEVPSDMSYQTTARRLKFGTGLAYFSNEGTNQNFNTDNKESITITPCRGYTSEVGTYTLYKNNGAIYYGYLTADKSNQFVVISSKIKPDWLTVGAQVLIEGYGLVKVSSINDLGTTPWGYSLLFTNMDNSIINADLSGCIFAGKKIYNYPYNTFRFLYSMKHHATKIFLNVFKNANGCKVSIAFKKT